MSDQIRIVVARNERQVAAGTTAGDLFAEVARKRQLLESAFAEMIQDGIDRGVFRADVDPRIATFGLVGMCAWAYQWLNPDGPLSVDEVARQFSAMVLEGLSA